MVKLKELKLLGIAVNTGADGGATSVDEIMEAVFSMPQQVYFKFVVVNLKIGGELFFLLKYGPTKYVLDRVHSYIETQSQSLYKALIPFVELPRT